jgi:integrase
VTDTAKVGRARSYRLTRGKLGPMIREAVKDQSYQASPLGTLVGRYIRWFRNEWGATPSTIRDYEAILARMAVTLDDREPHEVSIDDLRDVIELWAMREAKTRQKVTSVIRAFWKWAEEQGHIAISPATRIRRPRAERKVARVLPLNARPQLLLATKHPRDRLGLFCLLELGLRRAELANVRFRDFDPDRGVLRVRGKGQKERLLPLRGPILAELRLCLASDLPYLSRPPQGDDYLLYPIRTFADGKGPEGELRRSRYAFPKVQPSPQAVHRWWYRRAAPRMVLRARSRSTGDPRAPLARSPCPRRCLRSRRWTGGASRPRRRGLPLQGCQQRRQARGVRSSRDCPLARAGTDSWRASTALRAGGERRSHPWTPPRRGLGRGSRGLGLARVRLLVGLLSGCRLRRSSRTRPGLSRCS